MTAFRLDARTFEELPRGGPGRDPEGGFVVSEMVIAGRGGAERSRSATRRASTPLPLQRRALHARGGDRRPAVDSGGWALLGGGRPGPSAGRGGGASRVGAGAETTLTLVLHQNAGRRPHARPLPSVRRRPTRGRWPRSRAWRSRPEIVEFAAKDRGDADEGGAGRPDEVLPPRRARAGAASASALRAAELRKADLGRSIPQSLVTTTADAGARARAAARQLARRVG